MKTTWGRAQKDTRLQIRAMVSVEPGGLMRSADITITGYGGRSYGYEILFPHGRSARRHGIATLEDAKEEAEFVAKKLLEVFAEPVES